MIPECRVPQRDEMDGFRIWHGDRCYGSYGPVGRPIPLHTYRRSPQATKPTRCPEFHNRSSALPPPVLGIAGWRHQQDLSGKSPWLFLKARNSHLSTMIA